MSLKQNNRLPALIAALLVVAGGAWYLRYVQGQSHASTGTMSPPLFTRMQVDQFLAAAKAAESIKDPMQRCLSYPDPPGSNWSHDAVAAFCHYRLRRTMGFDEVRDAIQSGHAANLDQHLIEMARFEKAAGRTQDLVNTTLMRLFHYSSASVREVVDSWKRQSPNSAYAYAASGIAYTAAAEHARGEDEVRSTASEKLESMEDLVALARTDFDKAVALDPACIPAYVGIINAARLEGDFQSANDAANRALAIDPADYLIHEGWAWSAMPKWGGSRAAVKKVVDDAKAHEHANPLLVLVQTEAAAYAADLNECDCRTAESRAAFARVFDNVTNDDELYWAGVAAQNSENHDMAIVYLSEALRFAPLWNDVALERINSLIEWGDLPYSLAEAQRVVALAPHYQRAVSERGHVYKAMGDYARAKQDFETALTLPPSIDDHWTRIELGNLYVHRTHEWDKGWAMADQLIHDHPDEADGWIMRASIQKDQPRPGLHDTLVYVVSHFDHDGRSMAAIAEMRAYLAREKH